MTNSVTQSLITAGVHVIVGPVASTNTIAASVYTIPKNISLVSYVSTNPNITVLNDNGFVFRTGISTSCKSKRNE